MTKDKKEPNPYDPRRIRDFKKMGKLSWKSRVKKFGAKEANEKMLILTQNREKARQIRENSSTG